MKLELSVSITNVLRTLMYLAKLLTQEELPAEPWIRLRGQLRR